MCKTLYILRGVSGSGKTTLAEILGASLEDAVAISADDFWVVNSPTGTYDFDITRIRDSHSWCRQVVLNNMVEDKTNIIIHNTHTAMREFSPYLDMAESFEYKVVSLIVENRHGNNNIHDVPEATLVHQENKLRNELKFR